VPCIFNRFAAQTSGLMSRLFALKEVTKNNPTFYFHIVPSPNENFARIVLRVGYSLSKRSEAGLLQGRAPTSKRSKRSPNLFPKPHDY